MRATALEGAYAHGAMRITDGLVGDAVVVRPAWESFEAVVAGLVERLAVAHQLPQALADQAVRRICEREAIASTAMVDIGVSIPHARVDGVSGVMAALAVSPEPVYEVADGLPISIVALVLSPPALTGDHLNFLSSISMLLQSENNRHNLRQATSPDAVIRLVRDGELRR